MESLDLLVVILIFANKFIATKSSSTTNENDKDKYDLNTQINRAEALAHNNKQLTMNKDEGLGLTSI